MRIVIYSDLDGSLLDHHNYSHAAADATLADLERAGIPVVPCTSKTRAELLVLREELHNRHPFIIENGAAVVVPGGYFDPLPAALRETPVVDGFLLQGFVAPRAHWVDLVERAGTAHPGQFMGFSQMDAGRIAALTDLDDASAQRASQREFGEPVHWDGEPEQRSTFFQALTDLGAQILEGGRFAHVSGQCDKGSALHWLNRCYAEAWGEAPLSIAVGDGNNDIAMLEAADRALIVRSPVHPPPVLTRRAGVTVSAVEGPAGWADGVHRILATLGIELGGQAG